MSQRDQRLKCSSKRLRAKHAVFSGDRPSIFIFLLYDNPLCEAARNFMISQNGTFDGNPLPGSQTEGSVARLASSSSAKVM